MQRPIANISLSTGNPVEEMENGLEELEGSRTSQKNPQNKLTWLQRGLTETKMSTRKPSWD